LGSHSGVEIEYYHVDSLKDEFLYTV